MEFRLRCKDDSYRWFRSRGKALRDENGTFVRMVGTITDIDERKRAKQALLESHQYSQSVLDSMSEHVAVSIVKERSPPSIAPGVNSPTETPETET